MRTVKNRKLTIGALALLMFTGCTTPQDSNLNTDAGGMKQFTVEGKTLQCLTYHLHLEDAVMSCDWVAYHQSN